MKSKNIVITGSISTGKSLVSNYLSEKGYQVIDADKIAHNLMDIGQINYIEIVNHFGQDILNEDKSIDRKALAKIVFNDKNELIKLNSLTHDNIFNKIYEIQEASDEKLIFLDIPLYYESKKDIDSILQVDEVWLVYARPEIQKSRLIKRNNYSEKEAKRRIDSQIPIDEKKEKANFIIDNSGSIEETYAQINEKLRLLWKFLKL